MRIPEIVCGYQNCHEDQREMIYTILNEQYGVLLLQTKGEKTLFCHSNCALQLRYSCNDTAIACTNG